MSIYEDKKSYSKSKCVFLAGPIEWWWGERFDSPEAVVYRSHREALASAFVAAGFLVYKPYDAFKGNWNEKMQPVNDFVLVRSDLVVDLTPEAVEAHGTAHEISLAWKSGIEILRAPVVLHSTGNSEYKLLGPEIYARLVVRAAQRRLGLPVTV